MAEIEEVQTPTSKDYILDTNILMEDSECITTLSDNGQNKIWIPYHVLLELDNLKTDSRKGHIARRAIRSLLDNIDYINILSTNEDNIISNVDEQILKEIQLNKDKLENPIFVTNDNIPTIISKFKDIPTEKYKNSLAFIPKSEKITGLVTKKEDIYNNSFYVNKGKYYFYDPNKGLVKFDYTHNILNLKPKDIYQNFALELMNKEHIDIVSIGSKAGCGKTTLALVSALNYLFNKSKQNYEKIYITKPTIEIGEKLGYLPGDKDEKILPHMIYIHSLLKKICTNSSNGRVKEIFKNKNPEKMEFNDRFFEILPLQFIRGMDIENAIVILDECQNMTRNDVRAFLSRMGQNTKVFILGDICQIDHSELNLYNNGMNWIVEKFIDEPNYGHIVLNSEHSRGPICDLVIKSGL